MTTPPRIGSLDIETYGKFECDALGNALPRQTVFSPQRSVVVDKPATVICTAALTLPTHDPRPSPATPWNGPLLAKLRPGPTMVFLLHLPHHRAWLLRWLLHLDTLCGHNLAFDIRYLLHDPDFRAALSSSRHTLIDSSIVGFLQCEAVREKSLKDMGPVRHLYRYPEEEIAKDFRYPSPLSPEAQAYNAADAHNVLTLLPHLVHEIEEDYGPIIEPVVRPRPRGREPGHPLLPASTAVPNHKLSAPSVRHFSDTLWSVIEMGHHGIPMSHPHLIARERTWHSQVRRLTRSVSSRGLLLEGKGSPASKTALMHRAIDAIDARHAARKTLNTDFITESPILQYTKTGQLSAAQPNRRLITAILRDSAIPEAPALLSLLDDWQDRDTHNTLISRYTFPLLRHRRNKGSAKSAYDSILVPSRTHPAVHLAHTTWYVTPSLQKDDEGSFGGQKQARPSAQHPSAQQFPPPIKALVRSRFPGGSVQGGDLSQIELRVPTVYSGCPSLLLAFCPPPGTPELDLHADRAVYLFGESVTCNPAFGGGDVTQDPRQWGKRTNFADLYLSTAMTMLISILTDSGVLLPLPLLERLVNDRPKLRPGLWAWQQTLIGRAHKDHRLTLPITGHSRYFLPSSKYDNSEIVNFPVQAVAAITMLEVQHAFRKLLRTPAQRRAILPFINWYDALLVDCHPSAAADFPHLWQTAINTVATHGYWASFCDIHGRFVPLKSKSFTLEPPT